MTETLCEFLDDFLAEDLPDDRKACFQLHLDDCGKCQTEIEDWHELRRTLKTATRERNVPSVALRQKILPMKSIVAARKPNHSKAFATLAAGLVLIATAGWFAINQPRNAAQTLTTIEEAPLPLPPRPTVNVISPDDLIEVPIDIGDPNVVVVWVYPTIPIEHRNSATSKTLPFIPFDLRNNP